MELLVVGALEKLFKKHGIERLYYEPRIYDNICRITLLRSGRSFDAITRNLETFVSHLKEFDGCTHGYISVFTGTMHIGIDIIVVVNRMESCIYHHVPPTVADLLRDGIAHPPRLFQ